MGIGGNGMKKWYLKLDVNNVILDAIEYPFEGYVEVQLPDTQLPAGINGGWYKWNGTSYIKDDILYNANVSTQVAKAKEEGREEIRAFVRGAATLPTIGLEAKTELKNKGVLPR